jgi:hypothetical protein
MCFFVGKKNDHNLNLCNNYYVRLTNIVFLQEATWLLPPK